MNRIKQGNHEILIAIWKGLKIRTKLASIFMGTFSIVFLMNLFLFQNVNHMIQEVSHAYMSNVSMTQMVENLASVQQSVAEYLNTKNTLALQDYYTYEDIYRKQINELSDVIANDPLLLMEKNIRSMSEKYLEITAETMKAKRQRNVGKYTRFYKESVESFTYINDYIYRLNSERFKYNSNNYERMVLNLNQIEFTASCIFIIVIVSSGIVIYVFMRSITAPISELAKVSNDIAQGNFDRQITILDTMDEVGVLSRAFNHMTVSLQAYIEEIKVKLEVENALKEKELMMTAELKDAQLKYLQAQINPHFLFNTLNAGVQLAMLEGADTTSLFIQKMANFFRYNINKVSDDGTLEEELQLIDDYLYILNVRFDGEIPYKKQVDTSLLMVRIPRMIIQPVIENAVKYGIQYGKAEGVITLEVFKKEDFIIIAIKDSGIGMDEMRLKSVYQDLRKSNVSDKDSNGIGLKNVMARLEMYYGETGLFKITSEGLNKGTEVVIKIPYLFSKGASSIK